MSLDSTTSEDDDDDNHGCALANKRQQHVTRRERQPLNLDVSPSSSPASSASSSSSVDTDDLVRHLQDPTLPGRPKKKAKILRVGEGRGEEGDGGGVDKSGTTSAPHSTHNYQRAAVATSENNANGQGEEELDHFALPDADDDDDDSSDEAEISDNSHNSRSNSRRRSNKAAMNPRTVHHGRPVGKENHHSPTNRSPVRRSPDPGKAPPPVSVPLVSNTSTAVARRDAHDRARSNLDPSSRNPYSRPLARKPPPPLSPRDDHGSTTATSACGPTDASNPSRSDPLPQQQERCEPDTDDQAERAFFQVSQAEPVVREGLRMASSYDEHEPRSSFGFRNPHRGALLPPASAMGYIDMDDVEEYSEADDEELDARAFGFRPPGRRQYAQPSPTHLRNGERRVDRHPAPSTSVPTALWTGAAPLSKEAFAPAEAQRPPRLPNVLSNSRPRWDPSSVVNGDQSRRQPLLRDAVAADTANAAAVVASRRNRRLHPTVASTRQDPTGPTWTTAAYRPSHRPPSPGGRFNLGTAVLSAAASQRNDLRGGSGSGVGGLTFDDPLPESRRAPHSPHHHHDYYDNTDTEDYGFDDAHSGTARRGSRPASAAAPARSSGRGRRVASRQRSTTGRGRGRGGQRGRSSGRRSGGAVRGSGTRGRSSATGTGRSWGSRQSSTDVRSASRDDPNLQHVGGAEMSF